MKKIVTSIGMIVFAAAIVAGGTGAFFSDTETSTGNIFTAGAIDLKVDSVAHINGLVCYEGAWASEVAVQWDDETKQLKEVGSIPAANEAYNEANPSNVPQAGDACEGTWELTDLDNVPLLKDIAEIDAPVASYTFFDYGDLKPGDSGENTISLHVFDNDAYMCATVSNVEDLDNTQTEPEADAPDPDGLASGELDSELEFVIWQDDGDNVLEVEEQILATTEDAEGIEGVYDLFSPANDNVFPASTTEYLGVFWCYGDIGPGLTCDGSGVGNVSQTDSLEATISFYVEQARHNEKFTCTPRVVDETPAALTLDKIVGFSSTQIAGVDVNDYELHIVGPGGDQVLVDQIKKTGLTPGVYTISEVYSNNPTGVVWDAQFSGACTDNGQTGTVTLNPGDDVTCTIINTVSVQPT